MFIVVKLHPVLHAGGAVFPETVSLHYDLKEKDMNNILLEKR